MICATLSTYTAMYHSTSISHTRLASSCARKQYWQASDNLLDVRASPAPVDATNGASDIGTASIVRPHSAIQMAQEHSSVAL